ncbi:MAG: hypothetical protein WC087_03995 [Candidatus Paceibacterota bacterium]
MSTRNKVEITVEWSKDYPPSTLKEMHGLEVDGWQLPHTSDFEDAKEAKLQGFKYLDEGYWAYGHHSGDVSSIIPRTAAHRVLNSNTEKRRFRLIRRKVRVKRTKVK